MSGIANTQASTTQFNTLDRVQSGNDGARGVVGARSTGTAAGAGSAAGGGAVPDALAAAAAGGGFSAASFQALMGSLGVALPRLDPGDSTILVLQVVVAIEQTSKQVEEENVKSLTAKRRDDIQEYGKKLEEALKSAERAEAAAKRASRKSKRSKLFSKIKNAITNPSYAINLIYMEATGSKNGPIADLAKKLGASDSAAFWTQYGFDVAVMVQTGTIGPNAWGKANEGYKEGTGDKHGMAGALAKKMGASDEEAMWTDFGADLAVAIGVAVAITVATGGAGAPAAAIAVAGMVNAAATATEAGLNIDTAVATYQASEQEAASRRKQADVKDFEASSQMDQMFLDLALEILMNLSKRTSAMLDSVADAANEKGSSVSRAKF